MLNIVIISISKICNVSKITDYELNKFMKKCYRGIFLFTYELKLKIINVYKLSMIIYFFKKVMQKKKYPNHLF